MLAAITKSAQIPFSAWLPAAMAAPTPVSSLVHSSTLVTAGVYLLIRFNGVLTINHYLFTLAVLTMFISGVGANFEIDIKKIIALSTLSQLGVIIIILSINMVELAYFHLLSHALFKSLLFLCAGFYIHSMEDCQDIRYLGSIIKNSPIITLYFIGASISLCGFPFIAGFYSKDLILEYFLIEKINFFILILIFFSTLLTLAYSVRLISFIYVGVLSFKTNLNVEDEVGIFMPIRVLFLMSIVGGSLINWLFFPGVFIFMSKTFKLLFLIFLIVVFFISFFSFNIKNKTIIRNIYFLGSI